MIDHTVRTLVTDTMTATVTPTPTRMLVRSQTDLTLIVPMTVVSMGSLPTPGHLQPASATLIDTTCTMSIMAINSATRHLGSDLMIHTHQKNGVDLQNLGILHRLLSLARISNP